MITINTPRDCLHWRYIAMLIMARKLAGSGAASEVVMRAANEYGVALTDAQVGALARRDVFAEVAWQQSRGRL